jgi:hypothetical protein
MVVNSWHRVRKRNQQEVKEEDEEVKGDQCSGYEHKANARPSYEVCDCPRIEMGLMWRRWSR